MEGSEEALDFKTQVILLLMMDMLNKFSFYLSASFSSSFVLGITTIYAVMPITLGFVISWTTCMCAFQTTR